MALSITDSRTDKLARELAKRTGESITEAVTKAIEDRPKRVEARLRKQSLAAELMEIGRRCAALPTLDPRSADEVLGYDEHGLPR
jgi:antitoxin VapB